MLFAQYADGQDNLMYEDVEEWVSILLVLLE